MTTAVDETVETDAPSTIAGGTTISVGHRIESLDEMVALPIGTILAYQGQSPQYVKVAEDYWNYYYGSDRAQDSYGPASAFSMGGVNHVMSLPTRPRNFPGVGETIDTVDQMNALPVGAVVASTSSGRRYSILERLRYRNMTTQTVSYQSRLMRAIENGNMRVESLPAAFTLEGEGPKPETLERFKQRFVTVTLGAANRSSVSKDPLRRAFRKLGCTEHAPTPGMVVCINDSDLTSRLPDNTVLVLGDDPLMWRSHGVHVWSRRNGMQHVLGGRSADTHAVLTILSMPGEVEVPEWVTEDKPRSQCEAEVLEFKRQAWQIGMEAKRDNQWCGEYEAAMARCEISAETLLPPPRYLTAAEVAAMPVGSVFRFGNTREYAYYRRDDASTNEARTIRLWGTTEGTWARDQMLLIFDPTDGHSMAERAAIQTRAQMDAAPVGTTCREGWEENGTHPYTKEADGNWRPRGGNYAYRTADFSLNRMRFHSFPEPTA